MYDLADIQEMPQTDPGTVHHFSDSVYAKQMTLPKGHVAMSHKHTYSHLSILSQGRCIVTCMIDGIEEATEYTAPTALEIKAGVEHQIVALEDVTWFCIHATEEKDPNKIDEVAIAPIQ